MDRAIVKLSTALAITTVLTACSISSSSSLGSIGTADQTPSDKKDLPIEITVMAPFFAQTPAADNTPFEKKLEELTHSKLKIQWVSANNYNDKLNVTLASGEMPDMLFIGDPFASVFRKLASQGAFWDITPYIKDYSNLSTYIDKVAWNATKMADGKNYGVPRPRDINGETFFLIRTDWLDNVGLKEPKTSEELYQVMKAFAEQDPDQNGKKDTTGYGGYFNADNMGGMGYFESIFTGAYGDWKLQKDGTLAYIPLLPEERQALEYMVRLYEENLVPEDLGTLKVSQARDQFKMGKVGLITDKGGSLANYLTELRKTQPNASAIALTEINHYNPQGSGFNGMFAIPTKVPEARMKQILKTIDSGMNPEVTNLIRYGLEGVHHEMKNGEKVMNVDAKNRDAIVDYTQIFNGGPANGGSLQAGFPPETFGDLADRLQKIDMDRRKTTVPNYALGLYSETMQKINPELMKKNTDLKIKITLGLEPITAWDDYVAKLGKDPNVSKMIDEVNAAYQVRLASPK